MKKLSIIFGAAAFVGAAVLGQPAKAASIEGLPPEIAQAMDDLQATMYPPVVESVEVGEAAADAAVSIKATIVPSNELGGEAELAQVLYSTDCATWEAVDLEKDGNDFTGEIPGQASGTTVYYIITAEDLYENLYTEIACNTTPGDDGMPAADAPGWAPLASNEGEPEDAPEIGDASDEDLNILTPRVAVDDEFIYFEMNVMGKIKDGTSSPVNIHAHAGGVLNRDFGDDDLLKSVVLVYAPLAKMAGYAGCMAVYEKGGQANLDQESANCEKKKGSLYWSIPRALYGDNPSGQIKTMMLTGAISQIQPLQGSVKDHTRISLVNVNAMRSYDVP